MLGARVAFTVLLIELTLWAPLAHAVDRQLDLFKAPCDELLEPIPYTPKPLYEIEVRGARGEVASKAVALAQLADGEYIFLATSWQKLVYSPKFLPMEFGKSGRGLVTHKSLLRQLEAHFGRFIFRSIAGSGEFVIRNGRVLSLSNRSGNFRGTAQGLAFSEGVLRKFGLPVEEQTQRLVIDPNEPEQMGHTPKAMTRDEHRLRLLNELEQSRWSRELTYVTRQFMALLSELFVGALPGEVDDSRFMAEIIMPAIRSNQISKISDLQLVFEIIRMRNQPEGMEHYLGNFLRLHPPKTELSPGELDDRRQHFERAKIRSFYRAISQFEDLFGQRLSSTQLERLKKLRVILTTL